MKSDKCCEWLLIADTVAVRRPNMALSMDAF